MNVDLQDGIFLMCVLIAFAAGLPTNCVNGWFGANCQYKCRCGKLSCDRNGLCAGTSTCEEGWFGPACQYVDLGFQSGDPPVITDGNDSTCISEPTRKSASLSINGSFIFTWLRLVVSKTDATKDIDVLFTGGLNASECDNERFSVLEQDTIDTHCDLLEPVTGITLSGDGVPFLCSVYVSGGRNLALREKAEQSSTATEQSSSTHQLNISFTASRAVDGMAAQQLYNGFSCSMTKARPTINETWRLQFSGLRSVTKYKIYSRIDVTTPDSRLSNFKMESVDKEGRAIFTFTDVPGGKEPQQIYTLIHPPLEVYNITITNNISPKPLALCEVEVYGDSVCEAGTYGPECELTCRCPDNATCLVSTGGCPSAASTDLKSITCKPGTYGPDCKTMCSDLCAKDAFGIAHCTDGNGTCVDGCVSGYKEPTCSEKCDVGQFGKGCKHLCSQTCLPAKDPNSSPCDPFTGVCLLGCQAGSSGTMCSNATDASQSGSIGSQSKLTPLLIGLFVAVLMVLTALYCLRKKDTSKQPQFPEANPPT